MEARAAPNAPSQICYIFQNDKKSSVISIQIRARNPLPSRQSLPGAQPVELASGAHICIVRSTFADDRRTKRICRLKLRPAGTKRRQRKSLKDKWRGFRDEPLIWVID
jgi:hypothetical protein